MRKYLLLLALFATSNAFAWSLDARVPTKPVCDRIDPAPAKSIGKAAAVAAHEDATVSADNNVVVVSSAPTATPTATPPRSGGTMGFSRVRNAPRWQSFLPGMFK